MTTKQKDLMLTLYATLMGIYKEAENDAKFRNFNAKTFYGFINYSWVF